MTAARARVGIWTLTAVLAAAGSSHAVQGGQQSTPPEPAVPVTQAQLDRVRKALSQEPTIKLTDDQLKFYLEIVAKQPTFADYAKGYDFINGPTRGGSPMSHQEFLNLVTPKEMFSSAGITATDMLQFAVTNWLGQTLIRKALDDLKNARTQREVEEIRERIDRELMALRGAGGN